MVWKSLGKTYSGSFRELLTGDLPEEVKVLKSMMRISVRLKEVKWEI
ncbi:hypothetical protein [Autumnicola edwardsiae]|uniref:Uncharacterized protein n=1 Tax=Autumnicola edwardsiae TaxID=3075594 RepID=A0ABU3D0Q1_9FLAO|nr:hypothetical protein [Zunongwangia sp. F297]MDT0651730.1 hypothetical protein [Zunongwangia sp. F297]